MDRETREAGLRVELFVSSVARSAAFFMDELGFAILRDQTRGYTSLGRGGAVLGLNAIADLPDEHPIKPVQDERLGLGVDIVLMVEDVSPVYAQASAASRDVSALTRQPWGLTDFRLLDPDGYYIRVTGLSDG